MSDVRKHLRAVPAVAPQASAEREIAVRFTPTPGLVARLNKPLNSFHWVGPATLRFTSQGVLVTAKRSTWLGLRQTQHLIRPAEIRDVYREANAVQVHLQGLRKAYFHLWAEDSASAAQIVELLPTAQTIEFESAIRDPDVVIAWRSPAVGLVALLVVGAIGVLTWMVQHRGLPVREPNATGSPQARVLSQPKAALPTAKPQAVATGDDALLADQDLRVFGARIEALSTEFRVAWDALQYGYVSQRKFADESLYAYADDLRKQRQGLSNPLSTLRVPKRTSSAPSSCKATWNGLRPSAIGPTDRQVKFGEADAAMTMWSVAERGAFVVPSCARAAIRCRS